MHTPITNGAKASITFNGTGFNYKYIEITLKTGETKTKKSIDEIGASITHLS